MKSVKLDRRIIQTAIDLRVIKNDHKRDVKPWWKYDRLDMEIMDVAHEVELLQKDNEFLVRDRKELAKQIRKIQKEMKDKLKVLKTGIYNEL